MYREKGDGVLGVEYIYFLIESLLRNIAPDCESH